MKKKKIKKIIKKIKALFKINKSYYDKNNPLNIRSRI